MVHMKTFSAAALSILMATKVIAHPGHDHKTEAANRKSTLGNMSKRSLVHCQGKLQARGVEARNIQRRHEMSAQLRKTALAKRDFDTVLNTTHHSNLAGVTPNTDPTTLFVGNNSCVLAPETTEGPYYVVGEHCDAFGVYSGVSASGNGDSDSDTSNLNATFGRGIQATDADGVLQFVSIVPGHYTGRTNHIHILPHPKGTWSLLQNGTIAGGASTAHVGQLFFDQDMLYEVEALEPYNTNTQDWTLNSEDDIMEGEAEEVDPVVEYVLLGDSVSDGIFSWIAVGTDSTANYTVTPAAFLSANGGYANSNGPGAGGAPGNGTSPSDVLSSIPSAYT